MTTEPTQRYAPDERHRVKRIASRASYSAAVVHAILDAGRFCHVSFIDQGLPQVIPMTYWRSGEWVWFHAGARSRFAQVVADGPVALAVTLMDGLVLGHSAINHSMNYRSVVVHGRPVRVDSRDDKRAAMADFFLKTLPGRWETLREVRDDELDAVSVFKLALDQVAAKVRDEMPDPEEHMPATPVWTGLVPCSLHFGAPVGDPRFPPMDLPASVLELSIECQKDPRGAGA